MSTEKAGLRKRCMHTMRQLSAEEVEQASKTSCEMALRVHDWSAVHTALSYIPLVNSGELDPRYLTDQLAGVDIDYVEPYKNAVLPTKKYDVIIVPVVGFNAENYRLGRGGGWYDRLLALHPESASLGLAYAWSKVDFTPELHDVPLTRICRG